MSENTIREKLAALAHEQWSSWMKYLFSKSAKNIDGTVIIPKWAVEGWERQMNTIYSDLLESEKENDRREADKVLLVVRYDNETENQKFNPY